MVRVHSGLPFHACQIIRASPADFPPGGDYVPKWNIVGSTRGTPPTFFFGQLRKILIARQLRFGIPFVMRKILRTKDLNLKILISRNLERLAGSPAMTIAGPIMRVWIF